MTGLALAHALDRAEIGFRVYEKAERPGGVVRSVRGEEGVPLDLGPQRMRLTDPVRRLVRRAGLEAEVVEASPDLPLFVYREGRLREVPFSPSQALRTDLLSWKAKLRALLEPLTSPPYVRETVEEYFVRKFGRETYRRLLGPLYGGLYGSDPGRMPVRHALAPALEELEVGRSLLLTFLLRGKTGRERVGTASFREGMGAFPEALARSLGARVRLGWEVRAVVPGPGGRIRIEGADGEGDEVERVVLTCAAPSAARLLRPLSEDAFRRLSALTYNPIAVVHLRARAEGLRGYGYQVAFGESFETRGVTWNASIFGRDGLFTAFLGGMRHPEVVEEDDDRLGALAAVEFERATGRGACPLRVSRTWMPAWDRSWDALAGLELPPRVHLCASYTGRPGIPGRAAAAFELARRLGDG